MKFTLKAILVFTLILMIPLSTLAKDNEFTVNQDTEVVNIKGNQIDSLTEEELIKQAIESNDDLKKLEMNLELVQMSSEDIEEIKDTDVDDLIQFQIANPYRTKSKTEIRTEANITKIITPLQYEMNYKNLNRQIEFLKISIKNDAKQAVNEVLKAKDNLEQLDLAINRAEAIYRNSELRYNNGLITKIDFQKAKLNLESLKLQKQMVESNIKIYNMKLNKLIGLSFEEEISIKEAYYNYNDDYNRLIKYTYDNFLQIALNNRPDYLSLKENFEIKQKINEIYQTKYTIVSNEANKIKKEKEIEYLVSKMDLEDKEKELEIQILQLIDYAKQLSQQINLQEQVIQNAELENDSLKLLYENGMANSEQLLGGELQLLDSENKKLDLIYNFKSVVNQIEMAIGIRLTNLEKVDMNSIEK